MKDHAEQAAIVTAPDDIPQIEKEFWILVGGREHEDSSALFGDVKPAALIVGRDDLDRMVQSGHQRIEHEGGGRGKQHRCCEEECVHNDLYGRRPGGVGQPATDVAAVGGARSVAPDFQPGSMRIIHWSPRSGRQPYCVGTYVGSLVSMSMTLA